MNALDNFKLLKKGKQVSSWIMRYEDIEGLTANEIKTNLLWSMNLNIFVMLKFLQEVLFVMESPIK